MEFRKLIGFSNGSFVVTLPKAWISANKLGKGDLIGFEEASDQLTLYANRQQSEMSEREITINTKGKEKDRIVIEIITAYLNNYNIIEILSDAMKDEMSSIKEVLRNLAGMEIIEQTSTRIIAKDLIDPVSISLPNILRRIDVITRSMMNDVFLTYEETYTAETLFANLQERDKDVNRLYYLGLRALKGAMHDPAMLKKQQLTAWDLLSYNRTLLRCEEMADRQKRIGELLIDAQFSKDEKKAFKKAQETLLNYYNLALKAFYARDRQTAIDLELDYEKALAVCNKLQDMIATERTSSKSKLQKSIVAKSRIIENTKACHNFIRYISRSILSMDEL